MSAMKIYFDCPECKNSTSRIIKGLQRKGPGYEFRQVTMQCWKCRHEWTREIIIEAKLDQSHRVPFLVARSA